MVGACSRYRPLALSASTACRGDPVDVEVPVGAAGALLLERVEERRAPVVAVLLMAEVAHPVEGALLVAAKMLGELVERGRRLMAQPVDGLEPDEVCVFARDVLAR